MCLDCLNAQKELAEFLENTKGFEFREDELVDAPDIDFTPVPVKNTKRKFFKKDDKNKGSMTTGISPAGEAASPPRKSIAKKVKNTLHVSEPTFSLSAPLNASFGSSSSSNPIGADTFKSNAPPSTMALHEAKREKNLCKKVVPSSSEAGDSYAFTELYPIVLPLDTQSFDDRNMQSVVLPEKVMSEPGLKAPIAASAAPKSGRRSRGVPSYRVNLKKGKKRLPQALVVQRELEQWQRAERKKAEERPNKHSDSNVYEGVLYDEDDKKISYRATVRLKKEYAEQNDGGSDILELPTSFASSLEAARARDEFLLSSANNVLQPGQKRSFQFVPGAQHIYWRPNEGEAADMLADEALRLQDCIEPRHWFETELERRDMRITR